MNESSRKYLCYETMPDVVRNASGNIRDHLWSLYWLVRHVSLIKKDPVIVDIGVANGDSTRAILCACNDVEHRLTSIDYENCRISTVNMTNKFGLAIPSEHRWRFINEDSVKAAEAWRKNMAHGGIIAGHDFGLPDAPRDGVERSVNEFQENHNKEYILEGHKNCCGLFILWPIQAAG